MKTTTTLLSGVTVTAAAQYAAGAASVDCNALSVNDIVIEATATNGSVGAGNGKYIDIFWAWASTSISSSIPATLGPAAQSMRILLAPEASGVRVALSPVVTMKGRYAYIWYSHEALNDTVTLTVKVVS